MTETRTTPTVITGWRAWTLKDEQVGTADDQGRVVSKRLESPTWIGSAESWPPRGAPRARCFSEVNLGCDGTLMPNEVCRCGYRATRTLPQLVGWLAEFQERVEVVGEVSMWGRTIIGERGFRSEFMYPRRLWVLGPRYEIGTVVRELDGYGVPVEERSWRQVLQAAGLWGSGGEVRTTRDEFKASTELPR